MGTTFGILGRTALLVGGSLREDWGRPRERAVLATLLVHAGRWVPIDTLINWAWPQDTLLPQNPVPTFHSYSTRIRRSLQRMPSPPTLEAGNGGYRLAVDKSLIDFYLFRSLITQARTHLREHNPKLATDSAKRALELWRGRPLDDLASEPANAWRTRVMHEWLSGNATLLDALVAVEEFDEVLVQLDDLQTEHPDDVRFASLRLSALRGLARDSDATAYFLATRRRLRADGDEQAAEHLRQHHDRLLLRAAKAGAHKAAAPNAGAAPGPPHTVSPRQLPHDVVDFVGRGDLLAALDKATTDRAGELISGVVIMDGMAGVGKTALALHWGHRTKHRFPGGQLFANLRGFSEGSAAPPSTVVDDFLIALGHPPDKSLTRRSREQLLSRLLADRRTMIVLDNARDTTHVKDLVPLLAGSLVLVTSRRRLSTLSALTGARRVRVAPMTDSEATDLLQVRIGDRGEETADYGPVARLCGGLPLMVTLLAEHITNQPASQLSVLAQRLDRRRLITDVGERGDGPANAQAFFSSSYQALAEPERRLFRLLGLHPGPAISATVAIACDGRSPTETRESLDVLVGTHLLQPETHDRYQAHDLIHEFAALCAESDETAAARHDAERRMFDVYLDATTRADRTLYPSRATAPALDSMTVVEPVTFADAADAKAWFDQERPNLVAAVCRAGTRGHFGHSWRLADALVTHLDMLGCHDDSRVVLEAAVSSANAAGHQEAEASSSVQLGVVYLVLGEHAAARRCFNAGLQFAEHEGNGRGQASALYQLGRLETAVGDFAAALELYRRCLDIAQRINDREAQCWTHCRLGATLRSMERHDEGLVHLHQAQFLAQQIEAKSAHATCLLEIGTVYRDRADLSTAAEYCEQALGIAEAIPDLGLTAQVCASLAELNSARGEVGTAMSFARDAARMCLQTRNVAGEARARDVLGDIQFANGDLDDAALTWRQAVGLYDYLGNTSRATVIRDKLDRVPASGVDLPQARPVPASPNGWVPGPGRERDDRAPST